MSEQMNQLEALLFVAGDIGINVKELQQLLGLSINEIYNLIQQYKDKLKQCDSALELIQTADSVKLVTRPAYGQLLEDYAQSAYNHRLSQAALEILAIIAYKQPVTRLDIEDIRGVSSSGPIQKLILHDLIKEDGRLDVPGRPILYTTTSTFLDAFGLNDLDDLHTIQLELNQETEDLHDFTLNDPLLESEEGE